MTRPTGTKAELEARRCRAVDLLELGHGVREVAEVIGAQPGSVSRWKAAYGQEGDEGLAAVPRTNGRAPKLAEEHYPTLDAFSVRGLKRTGLRRISGRSSGLQHSSSVSSMSRFPVPQCGGISGRWAGVTRNPLVALASATTKRFAAGSLRPGQRLKKARTEGYPLVFVDECGFYLDPVVRRTWAPRGETPIQYSWTRQGRLSVFTALLVMLRDDDQPPDMGLFFWIRDKHYTGWIIYELLRNDLRYRWQDSILVLDN